MLSFQELCQGGIEGLAMRFDNRERGQDLLTEDDGVLDVHKVVGLPATIPMPVVSVSLYAQRNKPSQGRDDIWRKSPGTRAMSLDEWVTVVLVENASPQLVYW